MKLKTVLIGPPNSGKSCIFNRLKYGDFYENVQPSTQPAYFKKEYEDKNIGTFFIEYWDTAGQERFQSIGGMFYRDSDVAFICFNVETIDTIPQWISKVLAQVPDCIIFLVLTKEDLLSIEEKEKRLNDSTRLMEEYKAKGFYLTSAATGNGVANLFQAAGRCIEDICSISAPSTVEIQKNDKNDCKC